MATEYLKALQTEGTHVVGDISSIQVKTLANGAVIKTADVDNFTIVKLDGTYDADLDKPNCVNLAAATERGYIVASPEVRRLGENIADFYNGVGEIARLVLPEAGYLRFRTSAFSKNAGLIDIVKGNVAHYDPATSKFIVSEVGTLHAGYATAGHQFEVVSTVEENAGDYDVDVIRLMVTK